MPPLLADRGTPILFRHIDLHVLQPPHSLLTLLLIQNHQSIGVSTEHLSRIGTEPESTVEVKFFDRSN